MIEVEGLTVVRGRRALIAEVGLSVAPGEVVALLGPNGAGKSTTLSCIAGDLWPTRGAVRLAGRPVGDHRPEDLAHLRAVLPQSSGLAFGFTAEEVAGLGRLDDADRGIVRTCLARAGVDHLASAAYPTLSGGERQRVHFARILCQLATRRARAEPAAMLLDEPAASLDVYHQHAVLSEVRRLVADGLVGALVVLHDLNQALRYADRAVLLADGRVVAAGLPEAVLTPERLEPVYGVAFETLRDGAGRPVLSARPADDEAVPARPSPPVRLVHR